MLGQSSAIFILSALTGRAKIHFLLICSKMSAFSDFCIMIFVFFGDLRSNWWLKFGGIVMNYDGFSSLLEIYFFKLLVNLNVLKRS